MPLAMLFILNLMICAIIGLMDFKIPAFQIKKCRIKNIEFMEEHLLKSKSKNKKNNNLKHNKGINKALVYTIYVCIYV